MCLRINGYSLLEVIIASALALIVLGVGSVLLVPSLRASARGSAQSEMENQAVLVSNLLFRDLDAAVAQGVSLKSDGQTMAVMPIQDLQDDATMTWHTEFVVYTWDVPNARVLRRVWSSPGPPALAVTMDGSKPIRIDDASMSVLAGATSLETRILASGVTAFSLQQGGPAPSVTDCVTLTMGLQRASNNGKTTPERFWYTRSLAFRNRM
ncbi:MAG TPA: hypothetical protein VGO93_25300 [Candidatus Xenobia bacterium]|jgi:type II secretory pathway component PulJ